MKYLTPVFPFLAGWTLLLLSHTLSTIALVNGVTQLLLFFFVVHLPIKNTGRMSYVDIGWPLGVAVIGVVTLLLSHGYWLRVAMIGGVYLFVGLRMGLGALHMWRLGKLQVEFPRYEYQKLRWQREGKTNVPFAMQVEASVQGLANASYLAFPALIIGSNPTPRVSAFEVIGLAMWVAAFAMESIADLQKLAFLRDMKKRGREEPGLQRGSLALQPASQLLRGMDGVERSGGRLDTVVARPAFGRAFRRVASARSRTRLRVAHHVQHPRLLHRRGSFRVLLRTKTPRV